MNFRWKKFPDKNGKSAKALEVNLRKMLGIGNSSKRTSIEQNIDGFKLNIPIRNDSLHNVQSLLSDWKFVFFSTSITFGKLIFRLCKGVFEKSIRKVKEAHKNG